MCKLGRALGLLALVSAFLAGWPAWAEVKLPAIFSDSMVLQCDRPLTVWGWADPGEKVVVSIAGQTHSVTAAADGKWQVKLDALKPGGPLTMVVKGANTIELKDVLVGEVWLCSGQSNMAWTVAASANFPQEREAANYPQIRMFRVANKTAAQPQSDCQGQWVVCSPETVGGFSATGYFFGRELHQQLKVPVGLINSSWGGTPIRAWTSIAAQESTPELKHIIENFNKSLAVFDMEKARQAYQKQLEQWEKEAAEAKAAGKPFQKRKPNPPQDPNTSPHSPGRLYNAMIIPLAPFAIRGAIWYQGESDAGNAPLYGIQLRTMIDNWRKDWGNQFAFLFVQLPNFMAPQKEPSETGGWPLIREQFLKSLAIPNTGMAVTIDIGEANDIHPKNKQDVGKRLAQWALAKVYGKDVVACGPLYKGMTKRDNQIVISFDHLGGGLEAKGDKLKGFAIAGEDRKFVWADARIEGDTVVVSSPDVKNPVAVRYAWANNPDCNLYNKAGLPASPFRTDDWEQ